MFVSYTPAGQVAGVNWDIDSGDSENDPEFYSSISLLDFLGVVTNEAEVIWDASSYRETCVAELANNPLFFESFGTLFVSSISAIVLLLGEETGDSWIGINSTFLEAFIG